MINRLYLIMDKIIIKNLEVFANHGVHSEEKSLGQLFVVSVEITANIEKAALTDDLSNTIHYGNVCRDIEKFMNHANFNLIETVALYTAKMLFNKYDLIYSIKLNIKKPWAPIAKHLKYVAVEIERTREEMEKLEL
jgi:dihydroneopterin aldolase